MAKNRQPRAGLIFPVKLNSATQSLCEKPTIIRGKPVPKLEIDRRDFFRLSDEIHLVRHPIEKHMLSEDPYAPQFELPRQAILLSQLQAIDNESQALLSQISDSNRALGTYLRALDEKIECLAKHLVSDYDNKPLFKEAVDLSEGGIAFTSRKPLEPDAYIHLTMMLFPAYTTIAAIGQIKTCETTDDNLDNYRVGVEFTVLLEQDRKRLTKHIRRKQSIELRERSQKNQQN